MFDIGARISELRKQNGLTQGQLGQEIDMTRENIGRIENNKISPSVSALLKICETLGVSLPEFFSSDIKGLSPDLQQWLEAGKHLTPEQRKSLIEIIDRK